MKKILSVFLIALCAVLTAKAEVEFSYEVGAEAVSSYLWRGQYLGGLSFQPNATFGFEGEHTGLQIGAWGSVGASDWMFSSLKNEDHTYFVPEVDIVGSFSFYGITLGFTHYYYCDGGNFFGWKKATEWESEEWSSSTTEVQFGLDGSEFLPENHNLYANWYTTVAGNDFKYDDNDEIAGNNYSSYLEVGYDYTFDDLGLTLGGVIGMVPWESNFYGTDKFAATNLSLRLDKEWEMDLCTLSIFAQGMINPYQMANDKESVFVKDFGDNKIGCQSLNGTIGVGIWF